MWYCRHIPNTKLSGFFAFNKQFFIYYLRQYLNVNKEINDDDKISLKILDHDVNTVILELSDKNASLELENNNYRLNTYISINKIISEISEDTKDN